MKIVLSKSKNGRCLQKPFTLIELLVVVAIIGILASFLLPVLGKSRKTARIAVCTSNQKQINYALVMFTDDNDAYLPRNISDVTWDDQLSGYDGRPTLTPAEQSPGGLAKSTFGDNYAELYRCPLYEEVTTPYVEMSYAMTVKGTHKAQQGLVNGSDSTKINEVNDAAETIMLFDYNRNGYTRLGRANFNVARCTDLYNWEVNSGDKGEMLHGGLDVNYLFVDGHVQNMDFYATFVPYGAGSWDVRGGMWDADKNDPNM
jgi:prepilin-type N-terminal cleavage/methylation domain-containing protein/prepilin-type processing-associated H-X9-DG protein